MARRAVKKTYRSHREDFCCECGRYVNHYSDDDLSKEPAFCFECIMLPGWYYDRVLVEMFEPDWLLPEWKPGDPVGFFGPKDRRRKT